MKYSRTAIGLLTAQYRSVLKKCLLINLGLFALGAVSATPANAAPSTPAPTPDTITTWTGAQTNIDAFMDALHTWSVAELEVPDWDRQNGAITGWGMDQIFGALNGTAENPGILTTTQDAINLVNNATKGNENLYSIVTSSASGNTALHDAITVTTSGNYILSTNTAAENLGVLDTNLKSVATAVEGKLTGTSTAYDSGASGNTYYTAATINSNFATQTTVGTKLTGTALTTYKASPDATEFYNAAAVNGNFVKQEADKGLSSNDFTDTYKDSLDTLATTYQTKLVTANAGNGIAISGAQVISVNKGAGLAFDTDGQLIVDLDTVADGTNNHLMSTAQQTKLNNISTATTTSGDGYVTGELLGTTLNGYATTATASETANGLMSKENFSKLAGIEANAEVNTIEGVQLNGTDLTLDANKKANIVAATSANIAATVEAASDSKLVTEKAVVAGLAGKQATLVSGDNIKSINGQSVLGAGNLTLDEIGAQAKITSANPLSHELVSGLGTAATAAKSTQEGITSTDEGLVTGAQVASMNYLTSITSAQVTGALGFTPFDSANVIGTDGTASNSNVYSASAINTKLTDYLTNATASTTYQAKLTQDANGGANITIDADGKISATDTTYTAGDGLALTGTAFSVRPAASSSYLTFDGDGGLQVDKDTLQTAMTGAIEPANTGFVTGAQVASMNYLKNGSAAKVTLSDEDREAFLGIHETTGNKLFAGITIKDDTTNSIALTVNNDSNVKQAAIDINENGAFYSKSGTMVPATDEIATLGTAANGAYTNTAMTGVTTISGALDALQSSKQATLTAANAGAGLAISDTGQVLSVGATDSSITVGADGIAVKHDGSLAVDATNGLGVNIADTTITKDETSGGIKVGTIGFGNINTANIQDGAAPSTQLTTKSYVDESLTSGLATKADLHGSTSEDFSVKKLNFANNWNVYDNATNGIIVKNGTSNNKLTFNQADGLQLFDTANGARSYANVANNSLVLRNVTADTTNAYLTAKENEFKLLNAGNTYLSAAQGELRLSALDSSSNPYQYFKALDSGLYYYKTDKTEALHIDATTGNATFSNNVQAAGLTFDGTNIATSITKATSGETAGALSLATAGYAQEQAKAAADAAIVADDTNGLINFYNSSSTDPEAQTYTKAALDTQIGAKQNQLYYVDSTTPTSTNVNMNAEVVTEIGTAGESATALDANLASELAVAKALATKMSTADWTLATDATKLDGAKLGAGTVGFAAINPDDVVTSTEVATATLLDDTHLVTAGAVVAGINNAITSKEAYFTKEFGYNVHDTDAPTVLGAAGFQKVDGKLGFSQAIIQNKTAIGNIVSAATQLDGIKMLDNSDTPEAKTVHKIDNAVINDPTTSLPTGDEDVLATKATVLAALDNPEQDITANKVTANEVDTKALKVAIPADPTDPESEENVILEAKKGTSSNEIALNGATTVTGGLTADTLTLPNAESGATPITVSGIKGVSGDNAPMLITAGAVDAEFNTKVGTLTKNTGTSAEPVYTPVSVAEMIGVDANGALVFTEDTGVSNIASGDGSKSTPTTIVGAFENISSALGKIHGLATNNGTATEPNITVNNDESIFKAGNIVSSVTGETITSNLPTGTSVEEMEVYLDNAIGNIESGATLVGKAFADKDGNQIDTTYAKDADVVHLAGAETITGVKTFTSVVNANAGVKIGNDWQIDENPTTKAFIIRDASTTGTPMVAMITKDSMSLNSSAGNYFFVNDKGLSLNDTVGGAGTVFNASATTGDVIASKGKFTVATDTADATKVKVSVAGDIEATGNVKAASLTLPNLDQTTAGATITAQAIDNNATAFTPATDGTTLATLASVNTLAEKAHYTNTTSGLTADTIGGAIDELQATKQAQLYYMDGSTKKPMNAEVKTTIAAAATADNANLVTEKAIRTELDNITNGVTKFVGFTMDKKTASGVSGTATVNAIDDGNYSDELATTFATNLSVKSAVDKLVFGGNPNIWTGVNIFEKQIQAQKGIQIGADYKLVETDSKKLAVQIGNTGKSAMVVDKAGEFGLYKVDETAKTATPYLKATSGELRAYAANSTDGSNYQYMKSLKDYFYLYSENATTDPTFSVENATGNVNTKGNAVIAGNLTAGDATKAQLTVDNATNTISMVTTDSTDATKAAGFAADGNSAEMQASNGTYDFTFSADVETAGKEAIAMAVSQDDGSGNDIILSAVQADKDSISMGLGDGDATSNKMAAGFSVETDTSGSSPVTTVSMGLNDANENVVTGVKVEDGKVSILADNASGSANPVIEAGYSTTNGNYVTINGNETVTGDLTATGNFSAADGDFTVTKDATSGKTTMTLAGDEVVNGKATFNGTGTTKVEIENGVVKASNGFAVPSSSDPTKNVFSVDANGGVKAQSLNLPNANKDPAAKKTVTVDSIDTGSNPTLFEKNALATTEAIRLKAQNSAFSGKGQKSLKDPYGTGAAPTTLKDAINNLATNVDDAFGSIGQYSQLDAQSQIEGSNIHKDNPAVSPDTKSPTLVSAAVDLDNAIGNRALYNNSHYANTTDTKVSVSQAIANMDGAVYQDIHGQGDATTPLKGTVNIGDKAVTTKVGAQDSTGAMLTGMTVDTETAGSESIKFTVTDASAATPAPKDVMTINKDGVNVDGNENVTGKVTVAASSTATSKVEIDSADGSVTSTSTAGTVKLVDGTATASNTVTAGAVDATSGALSGNGVQMKNNGTVTAKNGAETAHYDAAGITLNSGTADTFTVDTTNGDMMAAAGNFAVTTASGKTTMTIGAPAATATTGKVTIDTTGKIESIGSAADKKVTIDDGNVVVSGNTKTATFEMPDADQPTGATSVVYAQVTGIDVGGATTNTTFSNQALATTESIKTKAENADYTASAALKAGNYATAQTSVATINNAIESLDLRIGDWDGLHLTPNGNLTNGHAGDAGYNEPTTVVEAFNNIDSTLGRIHGLVTENTDGTYTYNMTSGTETRDWTNLAVGTTVEEHVLAVNDAIGNRKGYTAAYNINRGESVAESLNNIDLRLGDVKSLNNMNYYGEQNPNDVNLTGAVRALDNNLYRVEHDLKTLRHETHAGLASAAALSALVPNPRGTGDTTLSFGTGAYQGHTAAALGGFHWITNNLLVNAGVGWDNREATTRIGVSYSF